MFLSLRLLDSFQLGLRPGDGDRVLRRGAGDFLCLSGEK